jgi:hypothetical protein
VNKINLSKFQPGEELTLPVDEAIFLVDEGWAVPADDPHS